MNKELGCTAKECNWEGQTYIYVLLLYKLWTSNLIQMTKINNICTHSYPNINNKVWRLEEDKLTLVVKTGSIKALSILMGAIQEVYLTLFFKSIAFILHFVKSKYICENIGTNGDYLT